MWLCTKGGFVSAVEWQGGPKDPKSGLVSVRAREKTALAFLVGYVGSKPKPKIQKKGGDYKFRVFLTKEQWVEAVAGVAGDVDYDNFKNAVLREAKAGKVSMAYEKALHRVWSIFGDLQTGGPYGWRRPWKGFTSVSDLRDRQLDLGAYGEWDREDDGDDIPFGRSLRDVTTPLTDEEIAGLLRDDFDHDRVDADPTDPRFLEGV